MTLLFTILSVLLLYALPAFVVWKSVRWLHTHVYSTDPTVIEILLTLCPVLNIMAAIAFLHEVQSNKESRFVRKFFGLEDDE
jgi:hypothetical protein